MFNFLKRRSLNRRIDRLEADLKAAIVADERWDAERAERKRAHREALAQIPHDLPFAEQRRRVRAARAIARG